MSGERSFTASVKLQVYTQNFFTINVAQTLGQKLETGFHCQPECFSVRFSYAFIAVKIFGYSHERILRSRIGNLKCGIDDGSVGMVTRM